MPTVFPRATPISESVENESARPTLAFKREKWLADKALRERALDLKEKEQKRLDSELDIKRDEARRSQMSSPWFLAILGAAAAALGNAAVAWQSARDQRRLENDRAIVAQNAQQSNQRAQLALESFKAESARILEVVKTTNDPDKAAENLKSLLKIGLISNPDIKNKLQNYLSERKPGQGLALPAPSSYGLSPAGPGYFGMGSVSTAEFAATHTSELAAVSKSLQNVITAIGQTEARIDSINTFDRAFLSFGTWQWNAGVDEAPGTLAGLLAHLKQSLPEDFQRLFGRHGLDIVIASSAGAVPRGFITLNGKRLDSAESKQTLRRADIADVFFQAGKDPAMGRAEMEVAADEIRQMCRMTVKGRPITDWIGSEYGIALLVDEYVNRPAHVPKTLSDALDQYLKDNAQADPTNWTTVDEQKLLSLYLLNRDGSRMIDSGRRAKIIEELVTKNALSDRRGSFVL